MNGSDLLTRYRATASDDAFAELVRRYANLIFSVARRRLDNPAWAEEATQIVFTRLAQSAPKLETDAELVAWLHRTTINVAIDLWRSESRRRTREGKAAMELTESDTHQLWQELTPHLDEALDELSDAERQVVLLRFFENKSMREIGDSLGVSEDAAKMRVSRALERLRTQLVPRGVACSVAVLGALIAGRSIEAAPVSLITQLILMPRPAFTAGNGVVPSSHFPIGNLKVAGVAALVMAIVLLLVVRSRQSTAIENAPSTATQDVATLGQPRPNSPFARRAAPGAAAAVAPAPEKVHVFFRVLAADTGQRLEGVQIRLSYFYAGGRGEPHSLVTDQNGVAAIPEANEGGDPGMNVRVSVAGYVPVCVGFGRNAPAEYVLKVQPAALAAGVVVDEQGRPVPGVKVQAASREDHQFDKPNTDFETTNIETDANGRWRYPYIPRAYQEAVFYLTCDGYAVSGGTVPMGKPESVNATLVIKRGIAVVGRVTDAQRAPIPGATVKEFPGFGDRQVAAETDGNGEFKLVGVWPPRGSQAEIVVESRGMAPQLRKVELRQPTNVVNFVLTKGNVFRGRVVDKFGQPLEGVACQVDSGREGRRPFQWFTHTDGNGRFEWDSAPGDPTLFWFELDGYKEIRDRLLKPDGSDHEIKLVPENR